jgi:hypothetical protein
MIVRHETNAELMMSGKRAFDFSVKITNIPGLLFKIGHVRFGSNKFGIDGIWELREFES